MHFVGFRVSRHEGVVRACVLATAFCEPGCGCVIAACLGYIGAAAAGVVVLLGCGMHVIPRVGVVDVAVCL